MVETCNELMPLGEPSGSWPAHYGIATNWSRLVRELPSGERSRYSMETEEKITN